MNWFFDVKPSLSQNFYNDAIYSSIRLAELQGSKELKIRDIWTTLFRASPVSKTTLSHNELGRPIYRFSKSKEAIHYLVIKKGVNVDTFSSNDKRTGLLAASETGDIELVRVYLELGADVNHVESLIEWTALLYASYEGHTDIVKIL